MKITDPEIIELEEIITVLDTAYEAGEECIHPFTGKIVSDTEYDQLRKRLADIAPNSSVLADVTASELQTASKKVKHNPPMTSISKAIGTLEERSESLKDFIVKIKDELNYQEDEEKFLVQAYKRDGVAIALYYEDGKLVRAGLRPRKALEGEDVTENVKLVSGVAHELWEHDKDGNPVKFLPVTCCIRGELECKKSTFRKVLDDWQNPKYDLAKQPANCRNYAAGSIRQFTNVNITKERNLTFTGYSILGWHSKDKSLSAAPFKTEIERAKYCNAKLRIPYVQVRPFRSKDLQMLEDLFPQLDYEVDGVVISVNNLEDAEQMGTHGNSVTGNPKAKLAWKFTEQSKEAEINEIVWTPGRSGKLTPVLTFDGISLDGTTVTQCTGHSLGFLDGSSKASLGVIGKGAKVKIIKSGKIIPKVVEIISHGKLSHPHKCPSCQSKLEIRQGGDGKDLVCNNEFCGVRAVARLVHFLSTIQSKGVSDATIAKILEEEIASTFDELFALTTKDLLKIGFTQRQALLTIARIWLCDDPAHKEDHELEDYINKITKTRLKIPAAQLFAALGIPAAGKTAGQDLISHFGTFDKIINSSVVALKQVDGLGEVSANNIIEFFKKYDDVINCLLKYIEPQGKIMGKLSGKKFVFTGSFEGGKQAWEKKVTDLGGTVSGSVGSTTTYVVVGVDAGSKEEKAKKLGITRLTPEQLEKML